METKFNYFIVGTFVILSSCILLIWGAWLFSTGKGKAYKPYTVYMQEAVSGLNVNAPVKFNGVDVGYVDQIKLDKRDPQQVILFLQIVTGTPINTATTATMMTQGLTGVSYIGLKMSNTKHPEPLHAKRGQKYPVIKSTPSLLLQLDTTVRKLVQSFEGINKRISELLTPTNQKAITHTLQNFDKITTSFIKDDSRNVSRLLDNSAQASQDMTPLISKLNDSATRLDQLTQTFARNPSIILRGQEPPPPGPGE